MTGRARGGSWGAGQLLLGGSRCWLRDCVQLVQQGVRRISIKIYIKKSNQPGSAPAWSSSKNPRPQSWWSSPPATRFPRSSCVALGKPLPLSGLSFPLLNEGAAVLPSPAVR